MDTDIFVINIFTEDFFEAINNNIERWFDTSNYDKNDKWPLQIGINKQVIGMFKDESRVKIMKEFCAPRAKTKAHLMDDDSESKNVKGTRNCIIKHRIMFEDYKDSLFNSNIILRTQLRFKGDLHIVYTEEVNKIVISSNDDKITTYPYGTNAFKVCESEMMTIKKYA